MKSQTSLKRTAGLLSFMLPGLGQVFLQHYKRGVALFAAFSLVVCFREARAFLPIAAFLVAAEAYRLASLGSAKVRLGKFAKRFSKLFERPEGDRPVRTWAYALVGCLGFVNWFLVFATVFYPFEWRMKMNDQAEVMADRVRAYASIHGGQLPRDLSEISGLDQVRDPWGGHLEVVPTSDGFSIRSAGKDHKFGSPDDLTYSYRLDSSAF